MSLQWNTIFLIYSNLLLVSCAKNSSLTFVIDDTLSMYNDIDQVRQAAADIMDIVKREKASEIENVVLVTFNDPDVVLREKTSDKDTLLKALNEITVHNRRNHDCPEYALSGIERALEESKPSSYLFVFTDASAKDYFRVNTVISLCQKKQSQVVFVLTDDCYDTQSVNYKVYHKIAKACNGQVFRVNRNEVQDVLETIKETITGERTVVTSQVVPSYRKWNPVPFTVDDQSEYVIVSTSGRNVDLIIKDNLTYGGNRMRVNNIMWKSSGKVVKFNAPKPGTYYAWVKADTDISIIVYARTDFSFNHGFSSFVPNSLEDTSKQPIKDEGHHLSITVTDPNHSVDIKYAEILDMQERFIANLPLKKVKGNFYITETFVSPSSTFKIQVTGINKNTGNEIKRFARTNVDPQDPPEPDYKAPEVTITEGLKVDVDYAGEITLTCKVSAYPKPEIVWTSDNGAILSSDTLRGRLYLRIKEENIYPFKLMRILSYLCSDESNLVEKPYDYISYLKLSNVKKAERYYCKASNSLASNVMAKIYVEPRNPLKAIELPEATSNSKFGKQKKLVCNVDSQFPLEIKWNVPLKPSDYSVSDDHKVLTINAVTIDAEGMYTCETSLKSDPKYKITATTTLTIDDLAPPTILNTAGAISRKIGDRAQIACKINGGVPPPIVTWQVMKTGEKTFKDILALGEELNKNNLILEDSGSYRCIAKNDLGWTAEIIELSVTKTPEAIIQEGQTIYFPYGSTNELTCKVTGNPLPSFVVWKDSKGNKLIAHQIYNNTGAYDSNWVSCAKNVYTISEWKFDFQHMSKNYEITSSVRITNIKNPDTYYCYADKAVSSIHIDVTSPFFVVGHPPASINSKYGVNTDITCNIQSKFPMEITWFYQNASTKTGRTKIHTSDTYYITSDQKTLRIISTDLKKTGTYTCDALINSDNNQRVVFTTNVQIGDLSPPELKDTANKVTVNYKDAVSLPCKIIGGTPPPTISWQVKYKGDNVFRNLPGSGKLNILSAALKNSGQYRCIARNDIGNEFKDIELVVQKVPETSIDKGSSITVPYGSTNELKCRVIAYPQPIIVWKNSKGHKLLAKDITNLYETVSILNLTNARSSETYSCSAENIKGTASSSIDVKVSRAITFPTQSTETTSVNFGTPAVIKCEANSLFPMKIKWLYQKNDSPSDMTEIHTSDKYTISSDGKMLQVISTNLDLVGTYTCEASLVSDQNEKGTHTNVVEINDLKAPEIFVGEKTITVMKGQSVSTSCRVNGVPKPTLTWQFKNKDTDTFIPLTMQGIQITNTGYSSAGTYMCNATNAVGSQSENIYVIVHGEPEITNVVSVYYGVKGDKVLKVPCEVTGVPEPVVVWKQGGTVLTSVSDGKITVNKNSLYVKDPTAKDSSTLTCEATNKYGKATKSLQAHISDFIELEKIKSRYIYLKQGGSTEDITCDLPNSGPSSIRWYVNSELSTVKSRTYSLQNANFSNDGNYTCRVNTDQGSESLNYEVDVGFLPRFIRPSTSPIYWIGNKKDILDCNVDAKPEGNTVWNFNGNEMHSKVPELFIMGWGRYTCNVTNVHGSVQRSFDVTSKGCIINRTVDNNLQNTPLLVNDKDASWPKLLKNNEFYIINEKQILNIQCGTKRNTINTFKIQPTNKKITAECYKEDIFIVDGKKYKFEELQCKEYVRPSYEYTKEPCMKNGEVIKLGFALDSGFLSAYNVCYDKTIHKTLYTKVLMLDQNLGNRVDPGFKVDTELSNVGQIVNCKYNKRRLVNAVDVAFGPAQASTLSEYNSVPVFEPCDGSTRKSWNAVEEAVNFVLENDIESFTVWTGASQYDAAGVPRYLWKVLMFEDNVETLVFVNAPDAKIGDIRCKKHDNEILVAQFTDDEDPYMYACSKDDFLNGFDVSIDEFKEK